MTLSSGKARLKNFACGGPLSRVLPDLGLFLGFSVPKDRSHFFVNPLPVHTSHFVNHRIRLFLGFLVLNGFPPFFLYNRYNVLCSNKLKAQINIYLSSKMQKTRKYGTNCSFSPHLSNHHHYLCLGTPLNHPPITL